MNFSEARPFRDFSTESNKTDVYDYEDPHASNDAEAPPPVEADVPMSDDEVLESSSGEGSAEEGGFSDEDEDSYEQGSVAGSGYEIDSELKDSSEDSEYEEGSFDEDDDEGSEDAMDQLDDWSSEGNSEDEDSYEESNEEYEAHSMEASSDEEPVSSGEAVSKESHETKAKPITKFKSAKIPRQSVETEREETEEPSKGGKISPAEKLLQEMMSELSDGEKWLEEFKVRRPQDRARMTFMDLLETLDDDSGVKSKKSRPGAMSASEDLLNRMLLGP